MEMMRGKPMRGIAARKGSTAPFFVDIAEPPAPQPGEVLCRTLELGICGTDREILHAAQPVPPAGEGFLVLGHECLARVEACGSGVDALRPGDLVVPVVRRPRGAPAHRVDFLSPSEYTERGIYAEHGFSVPLFVDRPEHLHRVGAELAPAAVLAEPVAVAEKAVNEALLVQQARLGATTWSDEPPRVLITGLGPIAFAAACVCVCRRWPFTVLGRDEPSSPRAGLVEAFGGHYLGKGAASLAGVDVERDGFDLVLECTGASSVIVAAARALGPRGAMAWLGCALEPGATMLEFDAMVLSGLLNNHVYIGSVNAAPRDFDDALRHLAELRRSHPRELGALVTARVTFDDALWHFSQRRPNGIKVVVVYEE